METTRDVASAIPDLAGRLEPKLWTVLREGISRAQLARDALSGVIVGIVALPLAIAFAIASGVRLSSSERDRQ